MSVCPTGTTLLFIRASSSVSSITFINTFREFYNWKKIGMFMVPDSPLVDDALHKVTWGDCGEQRNFILSD